MLFGLLFPGALLRNLLLVENHLSVTEHLFTSILVAWGLVNLVAIGAAHVDGMKSAAAQLSLFGVVLAPAVLFIKYAAHPAQTFVLSIIVFMTGWYAKMLLGDKKAST
jgi:hypothetical protein